MGTGHESFGGVAVEVGVCTSSSTAEAETAAVQDPDADTGRDLGVGHIELVPLRDEFQGRVEARRVAGGEELFGIGGAARSAHLLGNPHVHAEHAVVGVDVAVPAVARCVGDGGVDGVHARSVLGQLGFQQRNRKPNLGRSRSSGSPQRPKIECGVLSPG